MRKIVFLFPLILISFKSLNIDLHHNLLKGKNLKTLIINELNDSRFVSFEKAGIKYKKENGRVKISYKGKLITEINGKHSHLYQIFDKDFLIISVSKLNSMSGIDKFSRDSTYIYNLKNETKAYISLKNIVLEFNKNSMIDYYKKYKPNEDLLHQSIDSINIEKEELFLVQPNLTIIKYKLKKLNQ
jgi:hypothetical protein